MVALVVAMSERLGWFRLLAPGRLVAGLGNGQLATRAFIGGVRAPLWHLNLLGIWNVTFPFAKLTLFDDGLRISGNRRLLPMSILVPKWEARYEELMEVAAVGRIEGITSGVLFRTAEKGEWIVFWTANRQSVLGALVSHGVLVVSTPRNLNYLRPYRSTSWLELSAMLAGRPLAR